MSLDPADQQESPVHAGFLIHLFSTGFRKHVTAVLVLFVCLFVFAGSIDFAALLHPDLFYLSGCVDFPAVLHPDFFYISQNIV